MRSEAPLETPPSKPTYQPMVLVVLAFAVGIFVDRKFDLPWQVSLVAIAAASFAWGVVFLLGNSTFQLQRRNQIASLLLAIALIGLGAFWGHVRWNWFGVHEIGRFANDKAAPCCVEVEVRSEPRRSPRQNGFDQEAESFKTIYMVSVKRIRDGTDWIQASGFIDLVIHDDQPSFSPGDTIRAVGRLVATGCPSNPGQFDLANHYRRQKKLAVLHVYNLESAQLVQRGMSGDFGLSWLRRSLNELTWKYVGDAEAPFASAILLGNREQLSFERRDAFMMTGTAHLLAISGLHVGILAGLFFFLFRLGLISRVHAHMATIAFVVFFAWLVEFRPPATRAAILIVLFCLSRIWGEKHFSFNLLAVAGFIVLLMNPSDLFSLGPQLSFLAVGTLTFAREWIFWPPTKDPIKRLIKNTRPWPIRLLHWSGARCRTAFLVSAVIWLVAMPLIANRFHLVAPIALLINPLLLIPIAWGLYCGLGVFLFGGVLPGVAGVCGWACDRNLATVEWIIGNAQSVPGGFCWTTGPSDISVLIFYGGLLVFGVYPATRLAGKWLALLVLSWVAFGWMLPNYVEHRINQENEQLVCTFIDVGHGTSVLLQFPDGRNLLYDAGSMGAADYGARNISGVLWTEGIYHLDAIVVSHADSDHFNAIKNLLTKFSVGICYMTSQMQTSNDPEVIALLSDLNRHKVPIKLFHAGHELNIGHGVKASALWPPGDFVEANDNACSIVLGIEFQGQRILLPGDLEGVGLSCLLGQPSFGATLAMAPHHGSLNSRPQEFLAWSEPEFVVISSGDGKISDTAMNSFSGQGRDVARTDQDGCIQFTVTSNEVRVRKWNSEPW